MSFCFYVILVIITPKTRNQEAPESQEGEDVCFQRSELSDFHKTVFFKSDILTAEKFSIMELTVLKDETVKDMDLPVKLLSWPGVGPPTELSTLPRLSEQCSLSGNAC